MKKKADEKEQQRLEALKPRKGIWQRYRNRAVDPKFSMHDAYIAVTTLIDESITIDPTEAILTQAQIDILRIDQFLMEANGGGIYQYFSSSIGSDVYELPAALTRFGLENEKEALESCFSKFPDGKPDQDVRKRNKQLDQMEANLNDPDLRFFETEEKIVLVESGDKIEAAIVAYYRENIEEFPTPDLFKE